MGPREEEARAAVGLVDDQELARMQVELAHAMQTGVAMEHATGSRDGEPKHLRVGVNVALVNMGALSRLLVDKGVFTEREYLEATVVAMAREVDTYAARLGPDVRLT